MDEILIDGRTRLFGIVGDPVTQVQTPQLMNALFQRQRINAVLLPFHVCATTFDRTLNGLMQMENLDGLVITVPHKVRARSLVAGLSATAQRVGAINVMRRQGDGRWYGDMFDGAGLIAGLKKQGFIIADRHVKQLGAGGSGAAVAFALLEEGAATLAISDPCHASAQALVARINHYYPHRPARLCSDSAAIAGIDLLINCSPVGMKPDDGLPAPFTDFAPALQVVDIIMHPDETPLLRLARGFGCRTTNGKPMIEGQLQAFAAFFGIDIGETA